MSADRERTFTRVEWIIVAAVAVGSLLNGVADILLTRRVDKLTERVEDLSRAPRSRPWTTLEWRNP